MKFIGREKEQKAIDDFLNGHDSYRGCLIYGRRRLGKTELLKHCLLNRGIPCIFFQSKQSNEKNNVYELAALISKELNLPNIRFNSFADAIDFLFGYAAKEEIYLVIDEYSYIRKIVEGLDSEIQEIIDKYQNTSKIKFFLSGSSISIMESIQSESNPLYRRFSLCILLKEMDYYDSAKFYPSFSNEDKIALYSAFGGVPYYNKQIDCSLSVKDNIIKLLSGDFSHLLEEITTNVKEELTKINNANQVFAAIANGAFHYSDILGKANLKNSSALYDSLETLTKMDLVEYVCPINDKGNKKKSGYRITDNPLAFYYRYIFNRKSQREMMNENDFFDVFIKDDFFSYYVPIKFETVAKQYLIRMNKSGKLKPILFDLGTYWFDDPLNKKNGQFDVVGECADGYVFYEVKYTNKPLSKSAIEEEITQVKACGLKAIAYGFFSKSGFENGITGYQLYDLTELFK